ncbi:MAG TPA: phenylalanine--tRNA ligase subunit alpha [Acidimicrobiia bacterium]|nr:phenylalanine--tRNA ligase subunit alpha [Acidimicrobiia bacterium]
MEAFDQILAQAPARIDLAGDLDELATLEAELVGKRSLIAETRRGLGRLPADERPVVGARVHEVQRVLQGLLGQRRSVLERAAEDLLLAQDRVDVSLSGYEPSIGMHHILTQTVDEVVDIFTGLGYRVASGPEVELAWYNFDALNTPPTHPSRLESDTLYVDYGDPSDEMLLRTHTSPMQARYMEQNDPPVYVVVPGRTFRADALDPTHSPVFYQIEGLAVDENITFGDLKGTLAHFAREFFGPERKIRLMPHFFPFTEPSAEMHMSCYACDGSGCRVCSGSGWIELIGCGMVDPNVLDAVGYDSSKLSGFAFGMGAERMAMVRHGINHIKHFYENDIRVLRQFT